MLENTCACCGAFVEKSLAALSGAPTVCAICLGCPMCGKIGFVVEMISENSMLPPRGRGAFTGLNYGETLLTIQCSKHRTRKKYFNKLFADWEFLEGVMTLPNVETQPFGKPVQKPKQKPVPEQQEPEEGIVDLKRFEFLDE